MNEDSQSVSPRANGQWHRIVEIDPTTVPDNFQREVVIGDRVIAFFHHANQWFALDGMCAHQGGPLASGHVEDGCVTCPWHGWQYDLETGIQTINRQPLQESYAIRIEGETLEVWVPESR